LPQSFHGQLTSEEELQLDRFEIIQVFFSWITGPKSDFFLFVVLLVLVNLVSTNAFFRLDLTRSQSYSLSGSSRELVQTLEQPLTVQVFFSDNLPAPYNGVERYLRDLLQEYTGAANQNFSYEFFDMEKPENRETAESYGIGMVQIREVKDTEVGYKNAWMGIVLTYSDRIEVLDNLTTTDGLEYRLTTAMGKMVALTNSLAGLDSKIRMTLYATDKLGTLGLSGFNQVERTVHEAYNRLNRRNKGMIEWQRVNPVEPSTVDEIAERYGVMKINWNADGEGEEAGAGLLGIVLEHGDRFRTVPLNLAQAFGSYVITGLDRLDDRLAEEIRSLMDNSVTIGYATGHGEHSLEDARAGAGRLNQLVADTYTFEPVDLSSGSVPSHVSMLMINGPKNAFDEKARYALDQFLLRGGSLFLLVDSFMELSDQNQQYGGTAQFVPVTTGLDSLLENYGVSVGKNYVLDKKCYETQQRGMGKVPLYYVPLVDREGMNQDHPVSSDLAFVLFLQAASVNITLDEQESDRIATPLATSSPQSWLMSDRITLDPRSMPPPAEDTMEPQHLSVLVEGIFDSAFTAPPSSLDGDDENPDSPLSASSHLSKSIQPGKLLVTGTSAITTPMVMDEEGKQPVSIFVRNAIDYLNGRGDFAEMRTKGLSLELLDETTPAVRSAVRAVNLYGVPFLAALVGFAAWRLRVRRREKIRKKYQGEKGGAA